MCRHFVLLVCFLYLFSYSQATQYHEGDFVATAVKSQFHASRTKWHDLLGRHCPKFGVNKLVVMPLHKPVLPWSEGDEYKIMFSFDGERVLSTWLPVVLKKTTTPPILVITLTSVGSELKSIRAKVDMPSREYLKAHERLAQEYAQHGEWPQHLLVMYEWDQYSEVDATSGLFLLLSSAFMSFLLVLLGAFAKFGKRIEPAMYELVDSLSDSSATEPTQKVSMPVAAPRRGPSPYLASRPVKTSHGD